MENLLLSPDEQHIVLKFKIFLEHKFNVKIYLPGIISNCAHDIVVARVVGENIHFVKNFIQRRLNENKQMQERRIAVHNNVTTITLSESDSDSSLAVLQETQQKRRKRLNRRGKRRRNSNKQLNQLASLSSTIIIEDSGESANEESNQIQTTSSPEKENVKFIQLDTETSFPSKGKVESSIPNPVIPLESAQRTENVIEDNIPNDTIVLSDSPPPPNLILPSNEEKNIPNEVDDSIVIIEDEIPRPVAQPRSLRPIVIDGSNVARAHGQVNNTYSCKGIQIAINYFLQKGHQQVTAFVPNFRRHIKYGLVKTTDQPILEELAKEQRVVFTPSRRVDNKSYSCYDDRFIVKLATQTGGVILSNDNFRDVAAENEEYKKTVAERLLMFCFVGDIIMIPEDPLGRNGPSIDTFLSFPN